MYTQEKGKRAFVSATPEYRKLMHRKTWLSVVNIVVVFVIVVVLILAFLIIL